VSIVFVLLSSVADSFHFHRSDFGIWSVIAPSYGDIFRNNAMQNGLLPVVLTEEECKILAKDAEAGKQIEVDLEKLEVRREDPNATPFKFEVDPMRRHRLLNGLDDIALTLQNAKHIDEFEVRRSDSWPWLDGFGYVKGGKIPKEMAVPVGRGKKMDW
jgi:3-isopropylmalate dehydratase